MAGYVLAWCAVVFWAIVAVSTLPQRPVAVQEMNSTAMRAFTANEFQASYGLMVKYEHGRALASCPALFEYTGTPTRVGNRLFVNHKDMRIGKTADTATTQCTDDGVLHLTSSEHLREGSDALTAFENTISADIDTVVLFKALKQTLRGKRYYVGVSDSARECGDEEWFGQKETFLFFDESGPVSLSIVSKMRNQEPVLLKLSLIGDIRYMVAVRTGATCVYRVDLDVKNLQQNITRPSDSPTVSPSPSVTKSISVSPSVTPTPSVTASMTPSSSVTPTASMSMSVSPSASVTMSITPSISHTSSISPLATPSSSISLSNTPISTILFSNTPSSSASPMTTPSSSISLSNTPSSSKSPFTRPGSSISPSNTPSSSISSTNKPSSSISALTTPSASILLSTSPSPRISSSTPDVTVSKSVSASSAPASPNAVTKTPASSRSSSPIASASPNRPIPLASATITPTPKKSPSNARISPSASPSASLPAKQSVSASLSPSTGPTRSLDPNDPNNGGAGGGDRNTTDNVDGTSTCFPTDASVTLESGLVIPMNQLAIGDHVLTAEGKFSKVLLFTHSDPTAIALFKRLKTENGLELSLTPTHYLMVNEKFVRAGDVRLGDVLRTVVGSNGTWVAQTDHVVSIETVHRKGLYNPQTASGDIVVDGISTTCYTEAVSLLAAHALLAPVRVLARMEARLLWDLVANSVENVAARVTG